jgi:cobalamin biosynthesis Mg chelatase CobN
MLKLFLIPLAALTLVACCCAAAAGAESLVPPGNSAANQYTETFPTSKGEEDERGKKRSGVTPAQVLGAGKAHELEDKGPEGKAVADFAAETSPASGEASGGESASPANANGNGKADGKGQPDPTPSDGGSKGGNEEGSQSSGGGAGGQTPTGGSGGEEPSGSSGLSEVVSQATGTSSGTLGWLLPLILIAAVVWSVAYVWRNRQQRVV